MELNKLLDFKESILNNLADASSKVGALDYNSAMGQIYSLAPDLDKLNLSYFYDSLNSANATISGLDMSSFATQFFNVTEQLCTFSTGLGALEITKGIIDKIKDAATFTADKNNLTNAVENYDGSWTIEGVVDKYFLDDLPLLAGEQSGLVNKMIKDENKEEIIEPEQDIEYQPEI